jgi:hypothetical protein
MALESKAEKELRELTERILAVEKRIDAIVARLTIEKYLDDQYRNAADDREG